MQRNSIFKTKILRILKLYREPTQALGWLAGRVLVWYDGVDSSGVHEKRKFADAVHEKYEAARRAMASGGRNRRLAYQFPCNVKELGSSHL